MIDLDAYFRRIGYSGPREPTLAVLRQICRLHPAAIPFENIDALTGTVPQLGLEGLQAKLLEQRRGGYCFEQNGLLRAVLQQLGMQVTALAARVVWMAPPAAPPRARNHMVLMVGLGAGAGGRLIVDAGFGGQLLGAPLVLGTDAAQSTPTGLQRIVRSGDIHTVQVQLGHGWAPVYRFSLEPYLAADYEVMNWFTATHASSIFRHNLLMERLTPVMRATLLNDRLNLQVRGQPAIVRRLASAADLGQVLITLFDIQAPVPAAELYARLPKGHDSFVVPDPQ